jgi:hypothetical protein
MAGFHVASESRTLEANSWWMLYVFSVFFKSIIFMYMNVLPVCMYVPSTYRSQKRMLCPLELELLIIVKCHEVVETEPGVLWKCSLWEAAPTFAVTRWR